MRTPEDAIDTGKHFPAGIESIEGPCECQSVLLKNIWSKAKYNCNAFLGQVY